jgi:hypothetical protein
MNCVDSFWKLRDWDLNAAINIIRLLTTDLERPERPTCLRAEIQEIGKGSNDKK